MPHRPRPGRPLPAFADPDGSASGPFRSYPQPLPAVAAVAVLLAFFDETVDITVDDARLEHPVTPFTAALGARSST
ncbi:hypothetical protein [Streptomyces sp. NPDC001315]|uniref:hypothetical protein n=1 Tax=Streptomyces sp. NPDC001315 TaxID=3364562 RepID=UPI0036AB6E4C